MRVCLCSSEAIEVTTLDAWVSPRRRKHDAAASLQIDNSHRYAVRAHAAELMRNRIKNKTLDYIEEETTCTKMAGGNNVKEHNSDEIVKEYNSSLMDLTINSKPLINMLTLLAEDYIEHANAIVEAIENHLQKVSSEIKLPVLYLIDSIVKNVNRAYLSLFTKNIVTTFCSVFEKVDENTRSSMWKLRQTWTEVFPPKKLFALDVKVHDIDPAWPIAPLRTNSASSTKSIHVNPKFLTMQQQERAAKTAPTVPAPTPPSSAKIPAVPKSVSTSEAEMREKLLQKQKKLIELQKQKVELELLQAMANLEQQRRQLDKQNAQLPSLPDGALEQSIDAISAPTQVTKPKEKQFPTAAASLLKIDLNKTSVKIAPASSVAVASARPITSRDPRLKMAPPSTNSNLTPEELAKQQQLMHQLQLHMQSKLSGEQKQSSLLNDTAIKASSESELHNDNKTVDNKRAKDSSQKKDPTITSTTNITTSQRSNSIIKDQTKSSSSKSSSSRSSSSSSKTSSSSSSSSSSSRKVGSKSRSKSSSSSSPNKTSKLEDNSSPSSDKRSSSSSSASSKKSKSRKNRSPSPVPPTTATSNGASSQTSYRIPRRPVAQEVTANQAKTLAGSCNNKSAASSGVDEEEQPGSLSASLAHPPTTTVPTAFKEIRPNTRMRNYVRRNKEGSRSPEITDEAKKDITMPDASKDEDLRAPIVNVNVTAAGPAAALDTKDLDLRVLAVPNKRQSSDILESVNTKRSKAEKFDALFGNEDVDLRTLTNPKAGRSPTPPSTHTTYEKNKDSWAKLKTPTMKSERDTPKPLSDNRNRDRDRLGRPRLYNKIGSTSEDQKDGRRIRGLSMSRDIDKHNDRNADRNIEIIMKQAAEQLNQGQITKSQYNKLIQDVLHMSEDEKLKAAQRKEQEIGMLIWEKDGPSGAQSYGNDENVRKDHPGIHSRVTGPGGPRWQNAWHQPWSHGPFPGGPHGFPAGPDGFRPMGPWPNHPRMFSGPLRPDFHPPFHPGGYNPRMGPPPMGPNGPMMMPNGPINPVGPMNTGLGSMSSGMIMPNGPTRSDQKRNSPNLTSSAAANSGSVNPANVTTSGATSETDKTGLNGVKNSGELPPADPEVIAEIAKDTMKSISIDGIPREIRYYGNIGVVFLNWDDPRDIGFQDGTRRIIIDGKDSIVCGFNQDYKEFTFEGEIHRIKLGTPTRELYVDDKWYECYFGGRPIMVDLGNKQVSMSLEGPPPQVKIGNTKRTNLVLGKINLIINARNMVPVFLDAKPQMFEIEDRQFTLEFIDALQTVLLNGRPFKVEFGGLPKPILVGEKKHFIRFSVLPRGFSAGYVKITGMKGEPAKESAAELFKQLGVNKNLGETSSSKAAKSTTVTNLAQAIDTDTSSQDGMDTSSGSKSGSQLDVLSSVVPSAMAPSSGLSYQAEPVENPPAAVPAMTLPLNLNELFQRLVETGIVPNLAESKKPEEEEKKEPEIIPVSFDKPETLKIKNTAVVTAIYSGMQCSSCGARFAPEMATRYSHHLDWHFRQNRKERDSARKAHSRPWYYDQSDWIQFEEIEDLEDRAQSWFETEKQTAETDAAAAEDNAAETQQPSIPTGSDEDGFCEVCHEAFEQFYNEEKEEWHLRPAVTFEEKNYHPLCLEDHKTALEKSALALEESITEMEEEIEDKEENDDENKEDIKEEIFVKLEKDDSDEEMKYEDDDENEEKPLIKIEKVEDDEEDNEKVEEESEQEEKQEDMDMDDSEPIEIIEPLPRKIELEEIEDSSDEEDEDGTRKERRKIASETHKADEKIPDDVPLIFENVKVKEEPIDEDDIIEAEESIAEAAAVDTTQVAVKSSIDGNVELDSAAPTIPTAPSKIKLNITKVLVINKENDESKKEEKKAAESPAETAPAKPLIPAAIKPSLQGKKLSILPTVEKGHELSGLCSIM